MIGSLGSFFADSVAKEFVPVDLCLGHWQLPSECFESSVRHFHVVVRNGALVVALRSLHIFDQIRHELKNKSKAKKMIKGT